MKSLVIALFSFLTLQASAEAQNFSITCEAASSLRNNFSGTVSAVVDDKGNVTAVGNFVTKKPGNTNPDQTINELDLEGTAAMATLPPDSNGNIVETLQFKLKGGGISYATIIAQGNLIYPGSTIRFGITKYWGNCKIEKGDDSGEK
ncbi:MAG: hypothetical protein AB7O96_09470 [Pseudobdellovibrionaceae bacterium]